MYYHYFANYIDLSIFLVLPYTRFKLRHQQQEEIEENLKSSKLPAKKRKKSSDPSPPATPLQTQTTTCCLPAKKRVWALQPLSPEKPIQLFDLNLEYQQSPEKESIPLQKNPSSPNSSNGDSDLNFEYQQSPENESLPLQNNPSSPSSLGGDSENKEESQVNDGDVKEEEDLEVEEEDDGIVCDVCQSTDGDPSDPIVLCDGCDLMVHSTCYGDPLIKGIPEGDWFCCSCQVSSPSKKDLVDARETGRDCCLCPVKGGALKPTTDGRWAHILCALLVPEVFFKNPEGRKDIDCSRVPSKRWEEICYVCNSTSGCVIECSEPKCSLAFHVTCGLKEELCIEYREGRSARRGAIVAGFCKTHTQLWEKQQQTGKFKIVARDEDKK
ncbi:zinc finger protein [Macleaya cordata]|uniref:Zinc finger protein n=1 Tax=Macleaya cordata TaxID=56857 RepID=A0A200R897_MACCD|nr:zinc finger protein [Macleaya cordata]